MILKISGLVAAVHTPFYMDGGLNVAAIETQADHLLRNGVNAVFVGGTTGESASLALPERLALAERWSQVVRGTKQRLVVHVGANCLDDAKAMASQAESLGAFAISALAPSYFKPKSLDELIAFSREVATAAPSVPFYFYDIPSMTGVQFSMSEFLAKASERIPTLAGLKFTNPDAVAYQRCLHVDGGRFDVLWGLDECLLGALAFGATGAVGSSYNFAAPIYRRLIDAFNRGDLAAAREEQYRSVRLIDLLAEFGYMAAAKAVMGFLGVSVSSPRLPIGRLNQQETGQLRARLDELGFFDWVGG